MKRTVILPSVTAEILREYLARNQSVAECTAPRPEQRARGDALSLQSDWKRARKRVGLESFTFHDMRASGLTLAAQSGATIPELMARAGHSTPAAVLLYQRTAVERGAVTTSNMDAALRAVAN